MRETKDSGIEWIETIPQGWDVSRLKALFCFGKGLPITKENLVEKGNAVISYGQIHSKINTGTKVLPELIRFVDDSYLTSNPQSLVHKGDFIFADTSEDLDGCGNCAYIHEEMLLFAGYHTIILRSKEEADNRYLAYLFKTDSWRSQIRSKVSGVKLFSVSRKIFADASVILPPCHEQRSISDFLDCKCAEIDAVIERTKATIEEYKKLRQAIITDAVTKGVRMKRTMKNSENIWYGDIPVDWDIRKLKYMFRIKKDIAGREGYTVLSITQRGIRPKNIASNEGQLAENYSNYQLVEPGDFAMNHMDLLTGWVDISQYSGVTSPDYRVFNLLDPKHNCSKYYLYLMQMCYTNRIFYGLGQGVSGMGRWRLQADKFLNFTIPVPPCEEQFEIAEYLDKRCAEMDTLIAKKTALLAELEAYKKSVIYEYVTGKKEVGAAEQAVTTIVYPYFPAVLGTNKIRFAQAVLMSRILDKCRTKMGRVKLEKMLYTIETSIGFDFDTEYVRQAAGPLDESIYDCEAIISRRNKWYTMKTSKYGVSYTPTKDSNQYKKYYDKYFADYDSEIERIIGIFMDYDADQAEIVATLFAAWNDFVIDRKEFTDEQLVDEVLNNWNDSKKRFSKAVWLRAIEQMRQNNIVPKGYGKRTVIKN